MGWRGVPWTAILLSGTDPTDSDLRLCSSSQCQEQSSRSGLGTTMSGETGPCPPPSARETSGTRRTTWAQDTAPAPRPTAHLPPHGKVLRRKEATPDVDSPAVLEPSHVRDVEHPHQPELKANFKKLKIYQMIR